MPFYFPVEIAYVAWAIYILAPGVAPTTVAFLQGLRLEYVSTSEAIYVGLGVMLGIGTWHILWHRLLITLMKTNSSVAQIVGEMFAALLLFGIVVAMVSYVVLPIIICRGINRRRSEHPSTAYRRPNRVAVDLPLGVIGSVVFMVVAFSLFRVI